jgi:hypothetical protein
MHSIVTKTTWVRSDYLGQIRGTKLILIAWKEMDRLHRTCLHPLYRRHKLYRTDRLYHTDKLY